MREYNILLKKTKPSPNVLVKTLRDDPYGIDGKSVVSVVHSNSRREGITEALRLIGGISHLCEGVEGEIVIKPNCNTDDPFPRNTHHETVRIMVESLLNAGVSAERIVVGDMSGRSRGLPTRHTMENMGLNKVAKELNIRLSYFEEEDWVTVKPPSPFWFDGIRIPRRIYEADRLILTPVIRPHPSATFTMSLKLGVGLIDAVSREWLHNGKAFYEKLVEINLAFPVDLVVTDCMKFFIDNVKWRYPHTKFVEPHIIIAASNRVAADAVAIAIMKQFGAHGLTDKSVLKQRQLVLAEELGLGSPKIDNIILKTSNLACDNNFESILSGIQTELR